MCKKRQAYQKKEKNINKNVHTDKNKTTPMQVKEAIKEETE